MTLLLSADWAIYVNGVEKRTEPTAHRADRNGYGSRLFQVTRRGALWRERRPAQCQNSLQERETSVSEGIAQTRAAPQPAELGQVACRPPVLGLRPAMPSVLVLALVMIVGTGCSGPPSSTTRCVAANLSLAVGDPVSEATGQHTLSLVFKNQSTQACSLLGYPTVTLLDARGQGLPFVYRQTGDQMITNQPPRRVDLGPGDRAFETINKYRCDLGNQDHVSAVQLTLPADSTPLQVMVPASAISLDYCGPGDPGSILSVSPIGASLRDTLAH